MASNRAAPKSVDEYIAAFSPEVQTVLEKVRQTVKAAAPGCEETTSYQIPAFKFKGILVYFGAFKHHIGLYPPVSGDPELEADVASYAGDKGNLKFPLDQPIPYTLIERIVKHKVRQNLERAAGKK